MEVFYCSNRTRNQDIFLAESGDILGRTGSEKDLAHEQPRQLKPLPVRLAKACWSPVCFAGKLPLKCRCCKQLLRAHSAAWLLLSERGRMPAGQRQTSAAAAGGTFPPSPLCLLGGNPCPAPTGTASLGVFVHLLAVSSVPQDTFHFSSLPEKEVPASSGVCS